MFEINDRILIITNNPTVETGEHVLHLDDSGVLTVMRKVRDYLHKGHRLLTHPLAGSVKPNENPFKSIVVTRCLGPVDFASVSLLEGAIKTAERMIEQSPVRLSFAAEILSDLALIDLSLLEAGLTSLRESPWTIECCADAYIARVIWNE